jgi:hypothetical protein
MGHISTDTARSCPGMQFGSDIPAADINDECWYSALKISRNVGYQGRSGRAVPLRDAALRYSDISQGNICTSNRVHKDQIAVCAS